MRLEGDAVVSHALLDGDVHPDTVAETPEDGDLIVGRTTPSRWTVLDKGDDGTVLYMGATYPFWGTLPDAEHALVMGLAGAPPTATSNDVADFYVIVPFNMTLTRLKATMKTVPSTNTTFQVRRSVDSGASFADAFGTVTVDASAYVGTADPGDLDVNEGDVLNFSVTVGGGSGANAAIFVVGKAR